MKDQTHGPGIMDPETPPNLTVEILFIAVKKTYLFKYSKCSWQHPLHNALNIYLEHEQVVEWLGSLGRLFNVTKINNDEIIYSVGYFLIFNFFFQCLQITMMKNSEKIWHRS